jgi:proteic killer suppression protein
MIKRVLISDSAVKDLRKAPSHVSDKLEAWVRAVARFGLEQVRKVPGYHDEPLKGARKGQRSIRLSKLWRAIYGIARDESTELVRVEEVSPHRY